MAGRIFTGLTRTAFRQRISLLNERKAVRLARPLTLSCQRPAKQTQEDFKDEPIKFSTSKASHRTWRVDRSMGSQFERPWWKVLPVSLFTAGFLLWCALRQETDIDTQLERQLFEHLPGLLEEEEQVKDESS